MKKLKCFIFGHKWFYREHSAQLKPTTRICVRCERVELYTGNLTIREGYSYNKAEWKEIKKHGTNKQ